MCQSNDRRLLYDLSTFDFPLLSLSLWGFYLVAASNIGTRYLELTEATTEEQGLGSNFACPRDSAESEAISGAASGASQHAAGLST
jgi:hypothetical protein